VATNKTNPKLVARLVYEALVGLPVVRVLRVEFVGRAKFLLRTLPVAFHLRCDSDAEVRQAIIGV